MSRWLLTFVVSCGLVVGLQTGALGAGEPARRVEIVELPASTTPADAPVILWVLPGDTSWQQGKPLFDLTDTQPSAYRATGWMVVTTESILFHIVVKCDKHENNQSGDNLWNGDGIQMGIDALGRSSDTIPTPVDLAVELKKKFGKKTKDEFVDEATRELAERRKAAG